MNAGPLMTPDEACAYLGIGSPRMLRRMGAPAIKLGHRTIRYRRADLDAWLETKAEKRPNLFVPPPPGIPRKRAPPQSIEELTKHWR